MMPPPLFFPFAPFFQQGLAAARITAVERAEIFDAVGPETAVVLPCLAPAKHHPHQIEKGEREGPDHPFRHLSLFIAIGDDVNDLHMIRNAGLGVAMGNAKPEVQAIANRVIGSNKDEGLALFLEELVAEHVVEPLEEGDDSGTEAA